MNGDGNILGEPPPKKTKNVEFPRLNSSIYEKKKSCTSVRKSHKYVEKKTNEMWHFFLCVCVFCHGTTPTTEPVFLWCDVIYLNLQKNNKKKAFSNFCFSLIGDVFSSQILTLQS